MFKFDFQGDDLVHDDEDASKPQVEQSDQNEDGNETSNEPRGVYREFSIDGLVSASFRLDTPQGFH